MKFLPPFLFQKIEVYVAVREIAKTVYMVTSSKWRRCSSPVVMGPYRLLLFSSIVPLLRGTKEF